MGRKVKRGSQVVLHHLDERHLVLWSTMGSRGLPPGQCARPLIPLPYRYPSTLLTLSLTITTI